MSWKFHLAVLSFFACGTLAPAEDPLVVKSGVVLLKFGVVELEGAGGEKTEFRKEAESGESPAIVLRTGGTLRVGAQTDCAVVFPEAGVVKVGAESAIKIPGKGGPEAKGPAASLELLGGKLFLDIDGTMLAKQKKQFRLKTPATILAVKGTRFFLISGNGTDTAGVNQGTVEIWEPASGKSMMINSGQAVSATPGELSTSRPLSAGEAAYAGTYKDFAISFSPAEKTNRKFATFYKARIDPATAIPADYPKLIKAGHSIGLESGKALKIMILPLPGHPTSSIFAGATLDIPVRLPSEPAGILFFARGTDIHRFRVQGSLKLKDRIFKVSDSAVSSIPKDTPPDEWVPFFVPLTEGSPDQELEPGSIAFGIDPNLHEGRAVESIVHVARDKAGYVLEISPVMVGVRPTR